MSFASWDVEHSSVAAAVLLSQSLAASTFSASANIAGKSSCLGLTDMRR